MKKKTSPETVKLILKNGFYRLCQVPQLTPIIHYPLVYGKVLTFQYDCRDNDVYEYLEIKRLKAPSPSRGSRKSKKKTK